MNFLHLCWKWRFLTLLCFTQKSDALLSYVTKYPLLHLNIQYEIINYRNILLGFFKIMASMNSFCIFFLKSTLIRVKKCISCLSIAIDTKTYPIKQKLRSISTELTKIKSKDISLCDEFILCRQYWKLWERNPKIFFFFQWHNFYVVN